jgi:hypothetical protein
MISEVALAVASSAVLASHISGDPRTSIADEMREEHRRRVLGE